MIMLLINVVTAVALTIALLYLASGVLKFWRSVAMMQSQYVVSQNMDVNQRSAVQYDYLSSWLTLGSVGSNQIAWSIGVLGGIITLRIIAGAMYAYL